MSGEVVTRQRHEWRAVSKRRVAALVWFFSRLRGNCTAEVRRTVATANLVLPGIKKAGGRPWPQSSVFPPSEAGKGMSYAGGIRSSVAGAAGAC